MDSTMIQKTLSDRIATLLVKDTTTLKQTVNAIAAYLIIAPFNQTKALAIEELTLSDDGGDLVGIDCPFGDQLDGFDAITGDSFVQISPPVGGFRWEQSADISDTPVTVYGVAVVSHDKSSLFLTKKFETAKVIAMPGDFIAAGDIIGRIPASAI